MVIWTFIFLFVVSWHFLSSRELYKYEVIAILVTSSTILYSFFCFFWTPIILKLIFNGKGRKNRRIINFKAMIKHEITMKNETILSSLGFWCVYLYLGSTVLFFNDLAADRWHLTSR